MSGNFKPVFTLNDKGARLFDTTVTVRTLTKTLLSIGIQLGLGKLMCNRFYTDLFLFKLQLKKVPKSNLHQILPIECFKRVVTVTHTKTDIITLVLLQYQIIIHVKCVNNAWLVV